MWDEKASRQTRKEEASLSNAGAVSSSDEKNIEVTMEDQGGTKQEQNPFIRGRRQYKEHILAVFGS